MHFILFKQDFIHFSYPGLFLEHTKLIIVRNLKPFYISLGFGCDTAAVVNILAHRDATQRSLIQHEYRTMYGEELSKRLSSELSGDLKVE